MQDMCQGKCFFENSYAPMCLATAHVSWMCHKHGHSLRWYEDPLLKVRCGKFILDDFYLGQGLPKSTNQYLCQAKGLNTRALPSLIRVHSLISVQGRIQDFRLGGSDL